MLAVTTSGSPEAVQLVAAITILAGLFYIGLAIVKMGWISNFLSESVLTGFILGFGIDVVVGQLKKITGTTETGDNTWQKLLSWIQSLPDTNIPTLILGVSLIVLLVLLHRYAPKVPGALVAVVIGIGAAYLLPLAEMGVKLTGPVPSGLPSFVLPTPGFILENWAVVIPAAVGVLLVGFSESLAAARQYSAKYHYDIDVDQEISAQGNCAATLRTGWIRQSVGTSCCVFIGRTCRCSKRRLCLAADEGGGPTLKSSFAGSANSACVSISEKIALFPTMRTQVIWPKTVVNGRLGRKRVPKAS